MKKIFGYPAQFMRQIYDWTINWSKTKYAEYALFCISFAESSFFPVPPDVLLIPMVIADRKKWFRIALVCSIASVLGSLLGYFIGYEHKVKSYLVGGTILILSGIYTIFRF